MLVCVVSFLVKLFTVEAHYSDDPTVSLLIRSSPSLDNYLIIKKELPTNIVYVLVSDENDYIGSSLYWLVVSFGWIVSFLALVAFLLYKLIYQLILFETRS
ncbi:MAG: hypothetical protein JNN15_10645 [Blastocatellia bacterium]|nr:hypothetical protein [Blastocatellia bacterium]